MSRAANDPVAYASLVTISNSVAMAVYQMRRVDLPRVLVDNWPVTLLGPVVSTTSYLITIWSLGRFSDSTSISSSSRRSVIWLLSS